MPVTYWTYAFSATVYLINRMPTPVLSMDSPYCHLFSVFPYYTKLRIFGCLCYQWLRPYTTNKLQPRSIPCVLVGYSLSQSAYFCLDPSTSRIYVSRHVHLCENQFPFANISFSQSSSQEEHESAWVPIVERLGPCRLTSVVAEEKLLRVDSTPNMTPSPEPLTPSTPSSPEPTTPRSSSTPPP